MSRLRRQEIKRDEVREWMGEAIGWSAEHRRQLFRWLAVAGAVLLVGVLVFTFLLFRARRVHETLARALSIYHAPIVDASAARPDDPEAPSFADEAARRARAKELFESAEGVGWTDAGKLARVYLGEIARQEGDLAAAREHWQAFVEHRRDHALTASVWQNLLSLDREEGRIEEVEKTLQAQLAGSSRILPEDVLLWELGVTLELEGKAEEARDVFQRLADDFPRSPYTGEARARLEALQPRTAS